MNVWVKVVGFSNEERHAIQTMLRLSHDGNVRLRWWSAQNGVAPHLVLLDSESLAGDLEMQMPSFNPSTKTIVVGKEGGAVPGMWCRFERPLDWARILQEFEALFLLNGMQAPLHEPGDSSSTGVEEYCVPPGYKSALIVGLKREDQMYLKARLALQGIIHVDEVAGANEAAKNMSRRDYQIVIVGCPLLDVDVLTFIHALHERHQAPVKIVAVMEEARWKETQTMASLGVQDVLETPFLPLRVSSVLSQL